MNSPPRQGMNPCQHPELDIQSGACTTCGLVIEDRIFSTEDMEDRTIIANATKLIFGKPGKAKPPFLYPRAKKASSLVHIQLDHFCASLALPSTCKDQMYNLFENISKEKAVYGRSDLVSASIAFIIMRRQNYFVTFLDVADKFKVNVFEMGSTLHRIIRENNLPNIRELTLRQYMERAFQALQNLKFHQEINKKDMDLILSHANTLSDLADSYWLSQGRQHGPMAAAAIALAFKYNGFTKVSLSDVTKSLGEVHKTVQQRIKELNEALLKELVAHLGDRVESKRRKKCGFFNFQTDYFAAFIKHLDLKFEIQQNMSAYIDQNLWTPPTDPPAFIHSRERHEKTQQEIELAKTHIIANFPQEYLTAFSQKVGFFPKKKDQSPINNSLPSSSPPPSEAVTPVSPPLSPILSSTPEEQISSPLSQASILKPILTPVSRPRPTPTLTPVIQTKTRKAKRKQQQQQQQQQPCRNLFIEQMLLRGVNEQDILNGSCSYLPTPIKHSSNCPKSSNPSLSDEILCECDLPESELSAYLVPESDIQVRAESLEKFDTCRRVYKRHTTKRKNTTSLLFPTVIPISNLSGSNNDLDNSENDSNLESQCTRSPPSLSPSPSSSPKGTGRSSRRPAFSAYFNQIQTNANMTNNNVISPRRKKNSPCDLSDYDN